MVIKQIDAGEAWLQMRIGDTEREVIWTLRADGSKSLMLPVIESPSNGQTAKLEISFKYCNLYKWWFETISIYEREYRNNGWVIKSEKTQLIHEPPSHA
jgi:hypothetical protein